MLGYLGREMRQPRSAPPAAAGTPVEARDRAVVARTARRGVDAALRVLLVNPPALEIVEPWYDTPRFGRHGLACLAGYLRQFDGFAVDVLDAKLERLGLAEIVDRVAALRPDVVGLTAFTNEIKPAALVAGAIRARWPSIVTIIGGVHATALPTRTLEEFPEFDLACIGEGEVTLHELAVALRDGLALDEVDGLAWREAGSIRLSTPRARVADLDRFPPPAWDLLPRAEEYWVMTQRGCPFTCNFCVNPNGRLPRQASIPRVVAEIDDIVGRYRPSKLWFADEIFSVDLPRTRALLTELEAIDLGSRVRWWAETHVRFVDEALFAQMKRAGCEECALGIETGSQAALRRLGKGTNLGQIVDAFEAARRAELRSIAFFIFGHPHETPETMRETIELAVRVNPALPIFGVMVPYPGTEVAALAARGEAGYRLLTDDWNQFNKQTGGALEFAGLSRSEIERAQLRAYVEVFARNGRWRDLASFVWRYRAAGLHLVRKAAAGERRPTPPPAPSPGSLDEIAAATARWSAAQSDGVRRLRASAELARARVEPAARAHAPVR
jgi:radical SAM superfamily enzyme YgiQ (UPF0313 family)